MHAIELVDVAGVLCLGAESLLEDCPQVTQDALIAYWSTSRCRLDAWGRELRRYSRPGAEVDNDAFRSLAEEILLSQAHTRAMAALCVLHDSRWSVGEETGSIARNVLAGHEEAMTRLRPLLLPICGDRFGSTRNLVANRSRRWTDMLLGYLLPNCGVPGSKSPEGHVIEFAFDPERVLDFAYDAGAHSGASALNVQRLLSASLRMTLAGSYSQPANGEINRRIAGASLGLFGSEAFDDFGVMRTTWVRRLERSADETLGMVDGLFGEKDKPLPVAKRF